MSFDFNTEWHLKACLAGTEVFTIGFHRSFDQILEYLAKLRSSPQYGDYVFYIQPNDNKSGYLEHCLTLEAINYYTLE